MQLYIMRHGEAHFFNGVNSYIDAERPLTQQGQEDVAVMGKWLSSLNIKLADVFVSPFLRAQQSSARVLSCFYDDEASLLENNSSTLVLITPTGNAKEVHDFLDGYFSQLNQEQSNSAVLIVSHMPLVSYLVAELTQSSATPLFSTASIAVIDYNLASMQGKLTRLITPAVAQLELNKG